MIGRTLCFLTKTEGRSSLRKAVLYVVIIKEHQGTSGHVVTWWEH